MSKLQVMCLSFLWLVAVSAGAKTLYVDGTRGNDATTYENNSATSPWATIGRAAWGSTSYGSPNSSQAAKPGDIVMISAGVYWEKGATNGGRFTVSLNPVNNGTPGSPITFRGDGLVYVRLQAGFRGGIIGCEGRNYIVWDNLQIDDYYGGSTADTGPVVFSGNARHCQLINSDIKGHPGSYYHGYGIFGANYRAISLEPAHDIVIRNNVIHGFRGGQNEAGIMSYDSNDNVIENNEFFDNGTAVFIKGLHSGNTQARNIIRRNVVRDNWAGIRVLLSEDARVYQNVLYRNEVALWAGFFGSTRSRIVNNTVYANQTGLVPQGSELVDVLFLGNIISGNGNFLYNWDTGTANPSMQDVKFDRNLYFQNTGHAVYEAGQTIPFSTWQSQYRVDVNSRQADPRFVNASALNFRLQTDSTARGLSIDMLDLNQNGSTTDAIPAGAYVTGNEVIGRSSAGNTAATPNPPSSVTVQ